VKGYGLIGDVLVSEKKLDDIDRRLSQLGEARLSTVTELMKGMGIGAPDQVLEALGYEVKWYGLDQDKSHNLQEKNTANQTLNSIGSRFNLRSRPQKVNYKGRWFEGWLSQFDWFFEEIGSGIRALVEKFVETPYFFYSEQDMHAYLYHKLISGKFGEFFVKTHFGDKSVLLHKEYPTLRIYPGRRRGHFELAIIDPKYASESHWRMQVREPPYSRHRLKAAFEFGLNAIGITRLDLTHFRKDFERPTNAENKV